MINLALHLRMSGMQVSDADVDSRKAAVADLRAKWIKESGVSAIFKRTAEVAAALGTEGAPPPGLANEVEKAVQIHASAFLSNERPLEVGVCAAAAISAILENSKADNEGWTVANLFATAMWSALSFQDPMRDAKREALRVEVLGLVQQYSMDIAEDCWRRLNLDSECRSNFDRGLVASI